MKPQGLSQEELIRYSRHLNLSDIGPNGQEQLKQARVLCVGAGGLGSPALLYLAAAGIGTLGIIDSDVVELSNLQRQILFGSDDLGKAKVEIAKKKLLNLNPHIKVNTYFEALTAQNAFDLIKDYDVVIDGTDNFSARYLINDVCYFLKKPNIYASIFQFEGQCSVFNYQQGPCYRCLYSAPPPAGLIPNCDQSGVLGVLPGLLGTIQASEAIKLILGIGENLAARLLCIDILTMQFREYAVAKKPDCELCGLNTAFEKLSRYEQITCAQDDYEVSAQELAALIKNNAAIALLDVREPFEHAICDLGGLLLPLGQLEQRLSELDRNKQYIVYCKKGERSKMAAALLRQAGFSSAKSLSGGILAWAQEIDSTMPTY